jgi:hypothetical protein
MIDRDTDSTKKSDRAASRRGALSDVHTTRDVKAMGVSIHPNTRPEFLNNLNSNSFNLVGKRSSHPENTMVMMLTTT